MGEDLKVAGIYLGSGLVANMIVGATVFVALVTLAQAIPPPTVDTIVGKGIDDPGTTKYTIDNVIPAGTCTMHVKRNAYGCPSKRTFRMELRVTDLLKFPVVVVHDDLTADIQRRNDCSNSAPVQLSFWCLD